MRSFRSYVAPQAGSMQRCTAFSVMISGARAVFSVISGNFHFRFERNRRAQIEFTVSGLKRHLHIFLGDDERNVALRRSLGDGDDVDILATHGVESASRDAWGTAHVLADHGYDCDAWIHGDVFHFFMRHILRKFLAESLDGPLRIGGGNDETDVVL